MTISVTLQELLRTYLFLIPLFVMVLSEMAKILIEGVQKKDIPFENFFHSGGFPSSHSAFVTSLLIIVWKKTGLESVEFAIAAVFALIIWYDAVNSRQAIGKQAEALNRLQRWQHFQTRMGHSLTEVLGGIVFGALITIIGIWLSV